jgi:hypothetical protein
MPVNRFDLDKPVTWEVGDLFAMQLHNLMLDEKGIGKTESTQLIYDGKVLEVEEGKITKAVLQKQMEDGKYEQHTMPLRKVSDLISEKEGGKSIVLETYSPIYQTETPPQRYLFTVIAGARAEGNSSTEVPVEEVKDEKPEVKEETPEEPKE